MADFSAVAGKKYKHESSENFDDFLKCLGVNLMIRALARNLNPVECLDVDGDTFTITNSSGFRNSTFSFKLGEYFDRPTPDGGTSTSIVTREGASTLVEQQEGRGKSVRIVRTYSPTHLTIVLTVDDVVCTRIFKVQE